MSYASILGVLGFGSSVDEGLNHRSGFEEWLKPIEVTDDGPDRTPRERSGQVGLGSTANRNHGGESLVMAGPDLPGSLASHREPRQDHAAGVGLPFALHFVERGEPAFQVFVACGKITIAGNDSGDFKIAGPIPT